MNESAARITLSAKGLIMKIVGDVLIIETSDPDELRREVNRALGDEPLTVQGAARDYFGAQINAAPAGCLFGIQKIFDFVGPNPVDWPVGAKMCLKKTHIGVKLVHICVGSVRFGGQE